MARADRNRFDRLIEHTLEFEGGYANDPADPGGETKYGISKRSYPHLDIKSLTWAQAKEIYYKDWWLRLHCNKIGDDRIAQKLLDTAINTGFNSGIKIMQKSLRTLGYQVVVDGLIGPQTLRAVNSANPADLLEAMRRQQAAYYQSLIARNPALAVYEQGWMKRAYS